MPRRHPRGFLDPGGWILAEYGAKRSHGDLIRMNVHDFCAKSGLKGWKSLIFGSNYGRRDGKVEFVIQNVARWDEKVEILVQHLARRHGQVDFFIQKMALQFCGKPIFQKTCFRKLSFLGFSGP